MNQPPRSERLAAEIRAELGRQRKTTGDLAKHLHMSAPSLWRRMNGHYQFTFNELVSVADFFDLTVSELTERTESANETRTA